MRSHQLSIGPQVGMDLGTPSHLVWTGLTLHRSRAGNHSGCEVMSGGILPAPEDTVSTLRLPSQPLALAASVTALTWSLSVGKGRDTDAPLVTHRSAGARTSCEFLHILVYRVVLLGFTSPPSRTRKSAHLIFGTGAFCSPCLVLFL